jgi:hypothetical protein
MSHYKQLYFSLLPIPLTISSIFGIINGINYGFDNKCNSFDKFSGMVGLTSIGMITGITYPISFPILAGYILYKK